MSCSAFKLETIYTSNLSAAHTSGGWNLDFAGLGKNQVTEKNRVQAKSSRSTAHNITVAKFNKKSFL